MDRRKFLTTAGEISLVRGLPIQLTSISALGLSPKQMVGPKF